MALVSPMAPDLPDLALALSPPTFPRDESFRAWRDGANPRNAMEDETRVLAEGLCETLCHV